MSNARFFLILLCSRTSSAEATLTPLGSGRRLPDKSNADPFLILLLCSINGCAWPHLHLSCTPHWDRRRGGYGGGLPSLFNIVCSRTSSARNAFRSLFQSTRTPTTLPCTKGILPSFLILCAQERAVLEARLGPPSTNHTISRWVAREEPQYQTVRGHRSFIILYSRTSGILDAFRSSLHSTTPSA